MPRHRCHPFAAAHPWGKNVGTICGDQIPRNQCQMHILTWCILWCRCLPGKFPSRDIQTPRCYAHRFPSPECSSRNSSPQVPASFCLRTPVFDHHFGTEDRRTSPRGSEGILLFPLSSPFSWPAKFPTRCRHSIPVIFHEPALNSAAVNVWLLSLLVASGFGQGRGSVSQSRCSVLISSILSPRVLKKRSRKGSLLQTPSVMKQFNLILRSGLSNSTRTLRF